MSNFKLNFPFQPTGDQPQAIEQLSTGFEKGFKHQTLLGATGTGKTFTMANIIANVQKPTLVIAHNKTLAAQLASEFRDFFPDNAVEYFVSYYDYYQPEAYVPQMDLYIEKDSDVNEEIDKLRLAATKSLLTRQDVIIVASVSCIYNIGNPEGYKRNVVFLKVGEIINLREMLNKLISLQYERNDVVLERGNVLIKGDLIQIYPAYEEFAVRVNLYGDQVEKITKFDPITGNTIAEVNEYDVYPARHYIMPYKDIKEPLGEIEKELKERVKYFKQNEKLIEAQRIEEKTKYDLEMIEQLGYCSGIENYSRYFDGRQPGEAPYTLLDYFPKDYLMFIDESHMTIPQIRGMWVGERARKKSLIDYGFRLPSAVDNRPLNFEEFSRRTNQVVYVSATPADYELNLVNENPKIQANVQEYNGLAEQIIRPTGLLDPEVEVRQSEGQIEDLIVEIEKRVKKGQRVLVTTLTKRMAEDLSNYLIEKVIKSIYLHSDINTLERIEILRDLRIGVYDVLVGINLLREGLDLPEVSLVAILDADKEGFLRSRTSLIQTIGRAARNVEGKVIMYADNITGSMQSAIDETNRRRSTQFSYNQKHGITPTSIIKSIRDIGDRVRELAKDEQIENVEEIDLTKVPAEKLFTFIKGLEKEMKQAAQELDFEKAALLRDHILELKKRQVIEEQELKDPFIKLGKRKAA